MCGIDVSTSQNCHRLCVESTCRLHKIATGYVWNRRVDFTKLIHDMNIYQLIIEMHHVYINKRRNIWLS